MYNYSKNCLDKMATETGFIRDPLEKVFRLKVEHFLFSDELTTLSALELIGGKIKALIEHTAPRDLYDVHNILIHRMIDVNEKDLLRKIVVFYLVLGSRQKIKQPFRFENMLRLKFSMKSASLLVRIIRLVRNSLTSVFAVSKSNRSLFFKTGLRLSRISLFFNTSVFQPDLLFDDDEIIKRIREHPQAIRRTKEKFND